MRTVDMQAEEKLCINERHFRKTDSELRGGDLFGTQKVQYIHHLNQRRHTISLPELIPRRLCGTHARQRCVQRQPIQGYPDVRVCTSPTPLFEASRCCQ